MTQTELFDKPNHVYAGRPKYRGIEFLERIRISLRLDQILVGSIVFVILFAIIFSWGVETGKRVAWDEVQAERQKREDLIQNFRAQLINKQVAPAAPAALTAQVASSVSGTKDPQPVVVKVLEEPPVEGKYTIQSVTYKTDAAAKRQIQTLHDMGLKSFIIPSGSFLQVCIEAFETKQQALSKLRDLQTEGIIPQDAFVRNIPALKSS